MLDMVVLSRADAFLRWQMARYCAPSTVDTRVHIGIKVHFRVKDGKECVESCVTTREGPVTLQGTGGVA